MQAIEDDNTRPSRPPWLTIVTNNTHADPDRPQASVQTPSSAPIDALPPLEDEEWLKYVTAKDTRPQGPRASRRNKENKPTAATNRKAIEYLCLAKAVRQCNPYGQERGKLAAGWAKVVAEMKRQGVTPSVSVTTLKGWMRAMLIHHDVSHQVHFLPAKRLYVIIQ